MREKKGKYVDFCLAEFWIKFHEFRRKAEEDVEASGTAMPNDLQLIAIVAGGMSRTCLYEVGSKATHLIVESSRAATTSAPCCLDHKQRLMRRVEDVVSRVSAVFDEHMRCLFKHNHLTYIPFPLMMPLGSTTMSVDPFTSSSTTAAVGTSEVPTRNSITPSYIHVLEPTSPLPDLTDSVPLSFKVTI
ncbi:hypothetical protein M9H77_14671 [Catharanthus roseus]|uniref:Uncharacterized protein n=1 Tax=Catharanthus roseus TaxID=4058 RepID=A0ACC0BNZ7_CATRO|nr:hypothetical protein M9H77_14671 [Catharanthus roseus]